MSAQPDNSQLPKEFGTPIREDRLATGNASPPK